ncbi:GNAT family N-acetyltransferase [Agarivorans gilvus]|jgi:ribosomal protein S18 acetylase RimI-like enzyme|uniref:N-acetyltransferase n=1 Tax=Agarivorans gilvus TaxID=680279 RepID=A0ABQ1I1R7_9ALTE|nr:GNAT family N-acetyltransferase [Agarivorans gilvus]GGB03917.1 N-acetyltransferase [Agarivorans gilvus]
MISIHPITAEQTLAIRQQVLWPQHPIEFCRVAEDQQGQHFGGSLGDELVIVASLFTEQGQLRLRKFACLERYQGRGFGRQLLQHLIEQHQYKGLERFWFDARCSAIGFYQSLGFSVCSESFDKHGVAYVKMEQALKP